MPNKRIKEIRQLKKISQEQLAFEAGISQTQISKYEKGESVPNAEMLRKLAKPLRVEVFEFFYNSDKEIREAFERWQQRKS